MQLIHQFQDLLNQNQFLSGGLLLGIAGGVIAYARRLPTQLWHYFKSKFTTVVDIESTDPLFGWVKTWLSKQSYSDRVGRLSASSAQLDSSQKKRGFRRPTVVFTPAPGLHWLWYQNRLISVYRERNETTGKEGSTTIHETFTLRFYTKDRSIARQLLIEARDLCIPPDDTGIQTYVSIEAYRAEGWQALSRISSRDPSSIILAEGVFEDLLEKVQVFLDSKERYERLGIPYHMGILLQGPPGNGKSSVIRALATYFNFNLCLLNFKEDSRHLANIFRLFGTLPKQSFLVVEDVDRDNTVTVCKDLEGSVYSNDLGAILNLMDGLLTPDGMIVIMTANHPERLDPAFVRPGRLDHVIDIGNATPEMAARLYEKFFPERDCYEFVEMVQNMDEAPSMAKLQGLLIGNSTKESNEPGSCSAYSRVCSEDRS